MSRELERAEPLLDTGAISARVTTTLEPIGFQVVRLEVQSRRRTPLLRVYVDRLDAERVSIDDCVRATRALDGAEGLDDLFPGSYELEVSSPGAERPLVRREDYIRFQGARALFTVVDETGQRKRYLGRIRELLEQELTLEQEGAAGLVKINLAQISQAHLKPTNEELFKKAESLE